MSPSLLTGKLSSRETPSAIAPGALVSAAFQLRENAGQRHIGDMGAEQRRRRKWPAPERDALGVSRVISKLRDRQSRPRRGGGAEHENTRSSGSNRRRQDRLSRRGAGDIADRAIQRAFPRTRRAILLALGAQRQLSGASEPRWRGNRVARLVVPPEIAS